MGAFDHPLDILEHEPKARGVLKTPVLSSLPSTYIARPLSSEGRHENRAVAKNITWFGIACYLNPRTGMDPTSLGLGTRKRAQMERRTCATKREPRRTVSCQGRQGSNASPNFRGGGSVGYMENAGRSLAPKTKSPWPDPSQSRLSAYTETETDNHGRITGSRRGV